MNYKFFPDLQCRRRGCAGYHSSCSPVSLQYADRRRQLHLHLIFGYHHPQRVAGHYQFYPPENEKRPARLPEHPLRKKADNHRKHAKHQDYGRSLYKRLAFICLTLPVPDGAAERHPDNCRRRVSARLNTANTSAKLAGLSAASSGRMPAANSKGFRVLQGGKEQLARADAGVFLIMLIGRRSQMKSQPKDIHHAEKMRR